MTDFEKRIQSESRATTALTMDSMVCKDCRKRSPKNGICLAYPDFKPKSILLGGHCKEYRKEEYRD